jgi:alginate O-acetyltransferase complex protein AlgI
LIVLVGWTLFELGSVAKILGYLGDMFALNGVGLYTTESLYVLRSNLVLLLFAILGALPLAKNVYERAAKHRFVRAAVMPVFYALAFVISLAYIVDSSFSPFLYFRF